MNEIASVQCPVTLVVWANYLASRKANLNGTVLILDTP